MWFPTLFDDRLPPDFEQRCYPSDSDIRVYQYRDEPPAFQISADFEEIRPLLKHLGAPAYEYAIYCVRWDSAVELFNPPSLAPKRFLNYCVERFGLRIQPYPVGHGLGKLAGDIKSSKFFRTEARYWFERADYLVQVRRTRVFNCPINLIHPNLSHPVSQGGVGWSVEGYWNATMYLEECWHPNLGKTRTLCWSEPRESKAGVDEFKRDAIRILDGATPIGRPPGKRKFHSQEEFIPRYREAYLKAEKLGGATPKLVAAEMKISRSTFFRRLNEFHLEFPPDLT